VFLWHLYGIVVFYITKFQIIYKPQSIKKCVQKQRSYNFDIFCWPWELCDKPFCSDSSSYLHAVKKRLKLIRQLFGIGVSSDNDWLPWFHPELLYTLLVKYVTYRRKRFRLYKVYIFLFRNTSRVDLAMSIWPSVRIND